MSNLPTPAGSVEHRAVVVAGIRALADLIESNTALPVPDSVDAQYSLPASSLNDDEVDAVRAAAAELGVEPAINDRTATARKVVAAGGYPTDLPWYFRVEYAVYASAKRADSPGGAA